MSDLVERVAATMTEQIDSDKWLKPGDEIPDDAPLFIVNNSNTNKKFKLNDKFSMILTAPGTQGSIQSVEKSMLRNPAVMAMWSNGMIRITTDMALSSKVMTSIAARDAKRNADLKALRDSVIEDIDGGGNENEEDVSFKVKPIVSDIPEAPTIVES